MPDTCPDSSGLAFFPCFILNFQVMNPFKFAKIEKHPLRACFVVFIPELPHIPPFFGSLQECQRAAAVADKKAAAILNK